MAEYMEYKDSEIGKVGSVPAHWEITRIGNLFSEVSERYSVDRENILPLLSVSEYYGIAKRSDKIADDSVLVRAESLDGYKICQAGDIVSNIMLAWKGALGCSPFSGIVSPAYCVYRSKEDINPRYYHYLFRTKAYTDIFHVNSTGLIDSRLRLYTPKFFDLYAPIPTISEQNAIVDYLDAKIADIDLIIAEAKASIEEYKAWKASIIYEAVTKGLDSNVEMKDSGIEWLGTIPATWQPIRLKFLMKAIVDCPHETPEYSNDGAYYVIRTADQDVGYLRSDENMYRLNEAEYTKRIRRLPLNKDDIVYGREGERWGLACIVPESNKYCLGQRMMQFRCNRSVLLPEFARWALNSYGVYMQGTVDTIGSTSPHVNISTMRDYQIPIPSIAEQERIAKYITEKCDKIINLITEKELLITDLEAYKKSLIFEVVTGKRRVC